MLEILTRRGGLWVSKPAQTGRITVGCLCRGDHVGAWPCRSCRTVPLVSCGTAAARRTRMAARLHPGRVQAAHQSLHHFVAKADWFDEAVLAAVRAHVLSAIERRGRIRALIIDDTAIGRWLRPPWKTCMTSRTRSSVRRAFQIRRRRRSTSGTIAAFACIRPGGSVDNPLAACLACCNPMAMWNQPAIRGVLRSASERIDRKHRR
jgi:hypothetical protein